MGVVIPPNEKWAPADKLGQARESVAPDRLRSVRESDPFEEREREERTKTMLWLLVAAILGFVTWLASGLVAVAEGGGLFPCQDAHGTVPGGWPMSNWPPAIAAIIGGVLWVIGGFVARHSDHRRQLMVGFVVVYAAASAVLIVVAPAIWGAAGCVPDSWYP